MKPKPKQIETKKEEASDETNKYALALVPVKEDKSSSITCTDLVPVNAEDNSAAKISNSFGARRSVQPSQK